MTMTTTTPRTSPVRRALLTVLWWAWVAGVTVLFFCVACVTRPLLGHRRTKRLQEVVIGVSTMRLFQLVGAWGVRVVGLQHAAAFKKRPCVVIANHASFIDSAALSMVPVHKKYLTNMKYFGIPVFGWAQALAGDVGVNLSSRESRGAGRQACVDALTRGDSVVIYPEGTRQRSPPALGDFKKGAFAIARQAGVPILPVKLVNTYLAFDRKGMAGDAAVSVVVGAPIDSSDEDAALAAARAFLADGWRAVDPDAAPSTSS